MFDPGRMNRDRPGPDDGRLIVAGLSGPARRHAGYRKRTEAETADALAELREIAGDRTDLLAETAGLLIGFHEGALDEPRAKGAAELCRVAGANEALIPQWIAEGRRRAAAARISRTAGRP
jgi:hypothetical protein